MSERNDRLYDLLPAIYRLRDAEQDEPLRALLQVIAEQVNLVEDDISQLYENWFIETADDWVVPYIGDLVGFRPVQETGLSGQLSAERLLQLGKILAPRREIANTLRYRSQKGTLALLELLAQDTAGWPARAVEFYRLLGWTQALNFQHLHRGRTVDLRSGSTLKDLGGPFDRLAHTVEVRRVPSDLSQGRYNLSGVGLFIWRLRAYPATAGNAEPTTGRPPFHVDRRTGKFNFSSLGNDAPLFTRPEPEDDPTKIARRMNVPAPIRRRDLEERPADYYGPGKSFCLYRRTLKAKGARSAASKASAEVTVKPVPLEQIVTANLSGWHYRPAAGKVAIDPELGRIVFPPREMPEDLLVHYHYGFSADMGGGEYHRSILEEPSVDNGEAVPWKVYVHAPDRNHLTPINDAMRQWEAEKPQHAVIEITDSGIYSEQVTITFDESIPGQTLELRAADRCFPTIRLLNVLVNQSDDLAVYGGPGNRLVLDGLMVACRGVRINGDLDEILLRHATLVPGWELDAECKPCCGSEPSLTLVDSPPTPAEVEEPAVNGAKKGKEPPQPEKYPDASSAVSGEQYAQQSGPAVLPSAPDPCQPETPAEPALRTTRLLVQQCILGSIVVIRNAVEKEPLNIRIEDSILDATDPQFDALSGPDGTIAHAVLTIARSTVIGETLTHVVELGEDSIFYGLLLTARRQRGCLRFSYVTPGSKTPRRFNCQPDLALKLLVGGEKGYEEERLRPRFNDLRYGKPAYCQLAADCAEEITTSAEDESEMGAFHNLYQPQRTANLRTRLAEYTPASAEAGLIFVT
jgi:hypothetical protein